MWFLEQCSITLHVHVLKKNYRKKNKKKKKRKERCLSISLLVCGVSVVHHPMMSSAGVAASSSESMNRL